ncbi:pyridoxal phosphate-dependent transferase [Radiomyces spectabilis]|uniref:pyridoxal phosphate-dependent transferase n=1 Tax=Radiomyces spectabilis TaxID=64574 RepID=UPI0022212AA1|nr:pyridoxal phosphate-dependent transferase [Radiomyces spectabilis]KAI8370350.1 pyridoxal phosphate-dependent transferase [Radiomyces spectabilis]
MDYQKFISAKSQQRNPSPIRALGKYMFEEGMISLGAGHPNPSTFPYAGMVLKLKNGEEIEVDSALFQRSLSYDLTSGLPQLNSWLRQLQTLEHNPPVDFTLSIGSGSQDILSKALEMFIEPGAALLVEDPTYAGILNFLKSQPCDLVGIATDAHGLIPEALEKILKNWPESNPTGKKDQPRPQVLYTIPCGGNPTGASATFERKQKIYEICRTYDILIVEDDPYYYLQFASPRIASYLSIDVDGRVLRFDSMSKILSSGVRLGWVTGPAALVERIDLHTMSTNLQPAGVSQVMAYELLNKWGHEGFFEHIRQVSNFYREKLEEFRKYLDKRMTGYAEWSIPECGMFVWLKLLGGVTDSFELIMNQALKKKVIAVPGMVFLPAGEKTPYIRLSFSNVSPENMNEALRRLAEVVQEEADRNGVAIQS